MSIDHVSKALRMSHTINGTTRLVLIVLAEAANTDTDECWPKIDTIRARAGLRQERYVSKALEQLTAHGLVEVVVHGCPDTRIPENRRPNLYRLIGDMAVAGGARRAGSEGVRVAQAGGARRAAQGVRDAQKNDGVSSLIEPEVEPEENRDAEAVVAVVDEIEELCELLADRVQAHRGGDGRPKTTQASRRAMRLLIERGPLQVEDPEPVPPERVRAAIEFVFAELADPGTDGFCWADQIRSAAALRDHWVQLLDAGRRLTRVSRGRNAAVIDRHARRDGADADQTSMRELLDRAAAVSGAIDAKAIETGGR